jgi:hypothetical protein
MGQDYKILLYTVVAGTWHSAAGCLRRERLGERERTLYFHFIHISENICGKFPKMVKIIKNSPNLNMTKNDQEITYKI